MAHNTPRGTPARVLIIFTLLMGAVVVSALRDSRRRDLERISWPTAVGDTDFHRQGSGAVRIAVQGRIFSLREEGGRLQRRDDQMFRVPLAASQPRLYTPSESTPPDAIPPLYLKAASGEYLKVELLTGQAAEAALERPPPPAFPSPPEETPASPDAPAETRTQAPPARPS